ncbi:MAG: hypothetical protein KBF28_07680 [Gemmatimonadales bacterium]|nr:hypothetical protein [Gemmatimonadales bacterium]
MPLTTRATFRINLLLALLGAVVGALAAIPLTWVGKVLSGAPPADLANYLWNMRVFGIMGALFGPMLAWSSLRNVPLWRAALEPTIGALVGAALGMATGSEALFLLGTVAGLALPAWRLNRVYREVPRLDAATASEGLPLEP